MIVSTSNAIDEPNEEEWNGPAEEEDPKKKKGGKDEEVVAEPKKEIKVTDF